MKKPSAKKPGSKKRAIKSFGPLPKCRNSIKAKSGSVRGVVVFASDEGDTGQPLLCVPVTGWFQTLFDNQKVDIRFKVVDELKK